MIEFLKHVMNLDCFKKDNIYFTDLCNLLKKTKLSPPAHLAEKYDKYFKDKRNHKRRAKYKKAKEHKYAVIRNQEDERVKQILINLGM